MTENPIFFRIRKLLAMADTKRGASEAEAHTASTMVQRILQDNGLTMAEVEAAGGSTGEDGKRSKAQSDRRALFKWQQALMASLAENFFCMHMIEVIEAHDGRKMRRSKQHVLVGRFINVQATINMYDYLVTVIRRAADEAGFKHEPATEKQHHMFLEGATDRLRDRLLDRRLEREAEQERVRTEARAKGQAAAGTALVLADVYQTEVDLNQDVMDGLAPGTTANRRLRAEALANARQKVYDDLIERGVEDIQAFYMSYGYLEKDARKASADYHKEQAKPRKERAYRERGYSQADYRAAERRASGAYRAGQRAGESVGLDDQVTHQQQKGIR